MNAAFWKQAHLGARVWTFSWVSCPWGNHLGRLLVVECWGCFNVWILLLREVPVGREAIADPQGVLYVWRMNDRLSGLESAFGA
jgi:hypothetical protein